jgi:hypothetical protein
MLYNIDIWLEIIGTIWKSAESCNFSCAQIKIFMRIVYKKHVVFVQEKSSSVSRFQTRFVEPGTRLWISAYSLRDESINDLSQPPFWCGFQSRLFTLICKNRLALDFWDLIPGARNLSHICLCSTIYMYMTVYINRNIINYFDKAVVLKLESIIMIKKTHIATSSNFYFLFIYWIGFISVILFICHRKSCLFLQYFSSLVLSQ